MTKYWPRRGSDFSRMNQLKRRMPLKRGNNTMKWPGPTESKPEKEREENTESHAQKE
jgi:hypothetical protein